LQDFNAKRGSAQNEWGQFVPITHEAPWGQRSYQNIVYNPKRWTTRPRSACLKKWKELQRKKKEIEEQQK